MLNHQLALFQLYKDGGHASVELRKARIAQATSLVEHPSFAKGPLAARIGYLRWSGMPRDEIEEAFEGVDVREYEAVLAMDWSVESESTSPQRNSNAQGASGPAASSPDTGFAAAVMNVAEGFWRIGTTVFAYKGSMSYYPVPLLGFDMSRAEDVIKIAHQLPSGEYGEVAHLPPGFKGVIPDEYPMHVATRIGQTVICRDPDESGRERFREAVLLRIGPENVDGEFTVDIEWTHTGTRQSDVDYRDVRLLHHPKIVLQRLEEEEEAARKAQGANERMDSGGTFLSVGELSRAEQLRIAREKRQASDTASGEAVTDVDPMTITTHVRGFAHFPHLDVFEQPRDVRTGAAFVSQYGDSTSDGAPRTVPVLPQSQKAMSGVGFRFNVSGLEHHGRSRFHLRYNPIIRVAEQCMKNGSMFVDPDFPPSEYSLLGPEALAPGAPRGNVSWRRLSEIYYRPRLQALGSKAFNCQPGQFAPPWLTEMLGAFQLTTEVEDMVSPADDGWLFGAYVLRFFVEGRWGFVLVDDFVPCDADTGEPLGIDAKSSSDIQWALIEKAIAKLMGSYRSMQVGNPAFTLPRVWEDLSSNITDVIEHEHLTYKADVCSNLCDIVLEEHNSCCVLARVGSSRYAGFGAEEGALWLVDCVAEYVPTRDAVSTFAFHVVRRAVSSLPVKRIDLVREQLLEEIGRAAAMQLPDLPESEVSFWLSSAEYFAMFDRTYCLRVMNNFQKLAVNGTFARREGLGGKAEGDTALLANPQYLLSFMQPTECILELQLKDRRLRGADGNTAPDRIDAATLQLHLIKGHSAERPWTIEGDGEPRHVASSPLIDLREDMEWRNHPTVSVRLPLSGGNYILVPTVGGLSEEDFTLKVFSVSAFYIKLLN